MKEFLSIKEFAELSGIEQSTLRYWDDIGLFSPVKRDPDNNYRYYNPFQIIILNFIGVLVELGVPLSEIKELNESRTPETMLRLLSQQETQLDYRLYELRTAYSIIHTIRNNIETAMARTGEISVREMDGVHIVLGPETPFGDNTTFYKPFADFCDSANERRINLRYPIGGTHYSMDGFLKEPGRPNRFFSLDPFGNSKIEDGKYLVGYNCGYYGEFGDVPQRMADYAREHGLVFSGPVYVIYLIDEISTAARDQYVAQISARLK